MMVLIKSKTNDNDGGFSVLSLFSCQSLFLALNGDFFYLSLNLIR